VVEKRFAHPDAGAKSDVVAEADVVVVGGGFVGLATALALGETGRHVVVLEARTGTDRRFRGELIHPGGVRVLDELGLLPRIEAGLIRRCRGFAVTSGGDEDEQLLDYPATATTATDGLGGLVMHHMYLREVLLDAVEKRTGISLVTGASVVGVVREQGVVVGVTTRHNSVVRAGLTVVCDGRFSPLRRGLGFTPTVELISHTLVLTSQDVHLPHPGYGHVFLGGPGPVLAYEVGGGTVRFCVDIPQHLASVHRHPDERLLRSGYLNHLPEAIRDPIIDASRRSDAGMCANVSVMGMSSCAPGLALMGDSAVCSHPLTAMGMTAGLRDAIALRDELDGCPDQLTALYRFERRRLRAVWLRHAFTDSLYQAFSDGDEITGELRHGTFIHWRRSERGRARSMALLAGDDQRIRTFIAEYARVVCCAMTRPVPGALPHAVHSRIGLVDRVLRIAREVLARRCSIQVASFHARASLLATRRRPPTIRRSRRLAPAWHFAAGVGK
jgi:2-polyprenyl-6-methoxyphenol hydroxylase-like FAD-dependent oxidoreductase